MSEDKRITVEEAAGIMGVSALSVWKKIRAGELVTVQRGGPGRNPAEGKRRVTLLSRADVIRNKKLSAASPTELRRRLMKG